MTRAVTPAPVSAPLLSLTADRDALRAALAPVVRVAPTKAAMPVLACVLLTAAESGLALYATDVTTSAWTTAAAAVSAAGSVCLPAAQLLDAVKALPEGEVTLTVDSSHRATLRGGRRKVEVPGLATDDYPTAAALPTEWHTLPAETLARLLRRTAYARDQGEKRRPAFSGVYLTRVGQQITASAVDGSRMAHAEDTCEGEGNLGFILPGPVVAELVKTLDGVASIELALTKTTVYLRTPAGTIASRLLEDEFPSIESFKVLDKSRRIVVARSVLLESVKALACVTSEGIALDCQADAIHLQNSSEDGVSNDCVDAVLEGKPLVVYLNSRYLADALSSFDSDRVWIDLGVGALDPVVIRGAADVTAMAVVMPRNDGKRAA